MIALEILGVYAHYVWNVSEMLYYTSLYAQSLGIEPIISLLFGLPDILPKLTEIQEAGLLNLVLFH